jgi:uncharacterized protein YndB with AHSA1/START domain
VSIVTDLHTQTEIAASTSRVWSVLSTLDRYPDWNPWIRAVAGTLVAGTELDLTLEVPDRDRRHMTLVIERIVPVSGATLRLECPEHPGRVTAHELRLEPTRTGTVFHQTHRVVERGDGPPDAVDDRTVLAIEMMNTALKARAER